MKPQVSNNLFRTTAICIDVYDDKIMCGRLYNSYYNGGVSFKGVMDLLINIEAMLEDMNCPQAFTVKRSFRPVEEKFSPEPSDDTMKEGKLATFSLRILFRQNASWQGSLLWHEGRQEESFRSALEMLLLINSALETEKLSQ